MTSEHTSEQLKFSPSFLPQQPLCFPQHPSSSVIYNGTHLHHHGPINSLTPIRALSTSSHFCSGEHDVRKYWETSFRERFGNGSDTAATSAISESEETVVEAGLNNSVVDFGCGPPTTELSSGEDPAARSLCAHDGRNGPAHCLQGDNQNCDDRVKFTPLAYAVDTTRSKLTHTDESGKAVMVDVGGKSITSREARARAHISLGPEAFTLVRENKLKKGDVLTVAQLAGIMAAKRTADLIPLCHNIPLTKVDVRCLLNEERLSVDIETLVKTTGVTGVEMEALTAATVAALTVYDMCKAVTREMVISDVKLIMKTGGARGDYWAQ